MADTEDRLRRTMETMRGAGNTGVVTAARTHLGRLDLRPFGTRHNDRFRAELNSATTRLRAVLPEDARHWGLARKGLNIFLRDCLYTVYLRERYRLDRAEPFFEVPLDSISAGCIRALDNDAYLAGAGSGHSTIAPASATRTQQLRSRPLRAFRRCISMRSVGA